MVIPWLLWTVNGHANWRGICCLAAKISQFCGCEAVNVASFIKTISLLSNLTTGHPYRKAVTLPQSPFTSVLVWFFNNITRALFFRQSLLGTTLSLQYISVIPRIFGVKYELFTRQFPEFLTVINVTVYMGCKKSLLLHCHFRLSWVFLMISAIQCSLRWAAPCEPSLTVQWMINHLVCGWWIVQFGTVSLVSKSEIGNNCSFFVLRNEVTGGNFIP